MDDDEGDPQSGEEEDKDQQAAGQQDGKGNQAIQQKGMAQESNAVTSSLQPQPTVLTGAAKGSKAATTGRSTNTERSHASARDLHS